jgi:hypothetical protein
MDVLVKEKTSGEFSLEQLFNPPPGYEFDEVFQSGFLERIQLDYSGRAMLLLDRFPEGEGVSCCFVRLPAGESRTAEFAVQGAYELKSCPSGGWLLKPDENSLPVYWIPRSPVLRTLDTYDRILSEEPASITDFRVSHGGLSAEIDVPANVHLDWVFWRYSAEYSGILAELEHPAVLETQRIFLWNSRTKYASPADLYLYLVHGLIYVDRFIWPRLWKVCCELDAYELYVTLSGLEMATGKKFYDFLKRQILSAVITRQAEDGGWYQGEWVNPMESHYRFHAGAMLLLETALEEYPDDTVKNALQRAAVFISDRADETDLGLWFLHDSLEESVEKMDEMLKQTGIGRWKPSRILGKSLQNKLILNTHLDTTVTLDRYREVSGNARFAKHVESACETTRAVLGLRPVEHLYRLLYRSIALTLLPEKEAMQLPLPLRAIKRLTWKYITPNLYRIKHRFPRFVMPGGLVERHLSPLHFNASYHPVNVMDLARFWRRFPNEDLAEVIDNAVKAVTNSSILEYWAESKQQHCLVVWVEALYHLCTLIDEPGYRQYLAEAVMHAEEAGLGLSPSVLGANAEAVNKAQQKPCPSPVDPRLRVVNLSGNGGTEIIVVNPTDAGLDLAFEREVDSTLVWEIPGDREKIQDKSLPVTVPAHGWIWGREAGLAGQANVT